MLLVGLVLALLRTPVSAQVPTLEDRIGPADRFGAPLDPWLRTDPYWATVGRQPQLTGPGWGETAPLPWRPSLTHLPPALPSPSRTADKTGLEFHPVLSVGEEYSDNFRLSSTDPIDNFRSTLSPGLLVGLNAPRTRGAAAANFDIVQDSTNRAGDLGFFPGVSAAVKHEFDPRLSLNVADVFLRSDEPGLANQFGLEQQRRTFTTNTFGIWADWLVDVAATQAYYRLLTFSGINDTTSHIVGSDVAIPFGPLMAVKGGYEFTHSELSGETTNNATGNLVWASLGHRVAYSKAIVGVSTSYLIESLADARILNVSLFSTSELFGRFMWAASVGYSLLTSDAGDFSTISTDTNITYQFAGVAVSISLFQDFDPTFLEGGDFGVTLTRSYAATARYSVTPLIDTTVRAIYSDHEPTGIGNTATASDAKAFSAQVDIVYRVRRWLTAGVGYRYTRYEGGAGSSSGKPAIENRALFSMRAVF